MDESQKKTDIDLDPLLVLTKSKFLQMAANASVIEDSSALFEGSYNNREEIKSLPIEDVCWSIGQMEHVPDSDKIRLMGVMPITSNATSEPLHSSIALTDRMTFENQAMR
ncbi:unnamed protein product, partial [Lymnaea stagnalis]